MVSDAIRQAQEGEDLYVGWPASRTGDKPASGLEPLMGQPKVQDTGARSGSRENSNADLRYSGRRGWLDQDTSVSPIIATRNRCSRLVRCLQSVKSITFERPWELIIVDNGSTDETAAVVGEFIASASVPVQYVFEDKPGLGNAHNAGVAIARGKILAFTDDDCYPAPDFLSCIWSAFEDPALGYIAGRIMLHDPADYRMTINESMTPRVFPGGSFLSADATIQGGKHGIST